MREVEGHDRLLFLDGIRAVAVLSVVIYHAWLDNGQGGPAPLARALQMGAHGVDLFFVLSGFCLAYPYLRRVRTAGGAEFPLARFAAKRLSRIVPPYWLALFAVVSLGLAGVFAKPPPLPDIVKQFFFLDGNVQFAAVPFWTLPLEFRWYFIFPLALYAYVRAPRMLLAVALGSYALYDLARMHATIDFGTLPTFLAGIWVADLYVTHSPLQRFALPAFLAYGAIAFALEPDMTHQFYAAEPLAVVAAMGFIVMAGSLAPLRTLLAHRAFTAIGTGSYGIYLLHDPIILRLENVDHVAPWLAAVAAVVLSLGFSWLCERPFAGGPVRAAFVRFLEPRAAALCTWLGLPRTLSLTGPPRLGGAERTPDAPAQPIAVTRR